MQGAMLKLPARCRTLVAGCTGVLYATECSSLRFVAPAQGSAADAVCGSHAGATLSCWQSLLVRLLKKTLIKVGRIALLHKNNLPHEIRCTFAHTTTPAPKTLPCIIQLAGSYTATANRKV